MSIFGSLDAPDDEEHEADCGMWIKHGDLWEYGKDSDCTCGQPDSPLVYQGSHILPDEKHDKRGGFVDIAEIPPHITQDARDDRSEDEGPWPYLRFGVNESTVILTKRNVEQIAGTLNEWLGRVA